MVFESRNVGTRLTITPDTTLGIDQVQLFECIEASGFGSCSTASLNYVASVSGLSGSWSAVPVPAAAWLFSSGLIGLIRVARRKAYT